MENNQTDNIALYSDAEKQELKKSLGKHINVFLLAIQDYLILDEQVRILKKHFKITDKEFSAIINRHRTPTKSESELLEWLHSD